MKKIFKNLSVFSSVFILGFSLTACPNSGGKKDNEFWIMTWNGDGKEYKDIGHQDLSAEQLAGGVNLPMLYAVSKSYNENVDNELKINLFSTVNEGDYGGVSWVTKRENFKTTHNRYPDLFLSQNLVNDVQMGLVADLSVFKDDPIYKAIDPSLMKMMNYYGFQAGLPQYATPAGVYINRELARSNSIPVPDPDWTWAEYDDFIANATVQAAAEAGQFYGAIDAGMNILKVAYIETQLQNGATKVVLDNDDFKLLLRDLVDQSKVGYYGNGGADWTWAPMRDNMMLTSTSDPWMLSLATNDKVNKIQSADWDVYPRPALSNSIQTHVSSVVDPLAVFNACINDGKTKCSSDENTKIQRAWDFAKYWAADTRSWEARAAQRYVTNQDASGNNIYGFALSDTFPVVKGDEFDKQMEIWYSVESHAPLKDRQRFPGFAEVERLWKEGKIYGVSDKTVPRYYQNPGDATLYEILDIINNFGMEGTVGVPITDSSWYTNYIQILKNDNHVINNRYAVAYNEIKAALKRYYGWKDSDF